MYKILIISILPALVGCASFSGPSPLQRPINLAGSEKAAETPAPDVLETEVCVQVASMAYIIKGADGQPVFVEGEGGCKCTIIINGKEYIPLKTDNPLKCVAFEKAVEKKRLESSKKMREKATP